MSAFVVSSPVGEHIFSKFTEHDYKLNITYIINMRTVLLVKIYVICCVETVQIRNQNNEVITLSGEF